MNDKQEITELLARYADGVNSRDIEAWAAIWSEDGIMRGTAFPFPATKVQGESNA